MNSSTITVNWHDDNQPVYSVDFQPDSTRKSVLSERLVTAGGDNNIRIWKVKYSEPKQTTLVGDEVRSEVSIEYLSTLRKHTQAVNVVRFNREGNLLASAGDDGTLMLWKLSDHIVKDFGSEGDDEVKESWIVKHKFRSSTSEIYDISWSPNSKYIATGSMDNITRIYDVISGQQICQLTDHTHYVQGITWDPRNQYIATQSADRSVHIYALNLKDDQSLEPTLYYKSMKGDIPLTKYSTLSGDNQLIKGDQDNVESQSTTTSIPRNGGNEVKNESEDSGRQISKSLIKKRNIFLYHSETLQSFFRRLAFSPDGSLLLTTLGIYKTANNNQVNENITDIPKTTACEDNFSEDNLNDDITNTVYIHTRTTLNKPPTLHIPGLKKPVIAIRFSPIIYKLTNSVTQPVFKLPYKMVFAVATQDSIVLYDTEKLRPLGLTTNLHYSTITDLAWDLDGHSIIVSSADGFCSYVRFDKGVFGEFFEYSDAILNSIQLSGDIVNSNVPDEEIVEMKSSPVKETAKKDSPNIINQLVKRSKLNESADKKKRRVVPTLVTEGN